NSGDGNQGHVWVALSTGTSFAASTLWDSFFCIGGEFPVIADVNGDGKADILTYLRGSSGYVYAALSTGSAFGASSVWNTWMGINSELVGAGDFTGDGKADAIVFHRGSTGDANKGHVSVAPSTGSSFSASSMWHTNMGIDNEIPQP